MPVVGPLAPVAEVGVAGALAPPAEVWFADTDPPGPAAYWVRAARTSPEAEPVAGAGAAGAVGSEAPPGSVEDAVPPIPVAGALAPAEADPDADPPAAGCAAGTARPSAAAISEVGSEDEETVAARPPPATRARVGVVGAGSEARRVGVRGVLLPSLRGGLLALAFRKCGPGHLS